MVWAAHWYDPWLNLIPVHPLSVYKFEQHNSILSNLIKHIRGIHHIEHNVYHTNN